MNWPAIDALAEKRRELYRQERLAWEALVEARANLAAQPGFPEAAHRAWDVTERWLSASQDVYDFERKRRGK